MLTPLEAESLETIMLIKDKILAGRCSKIEFRQIMGIAIENVKHLENKKYGCWSGRHAGPCDCTQIQVGKSVNRHQPMMRP